MLNLESELNLNTNRFNNILKSLGVNISNEKLTLAMRKYYDLPEKKKSKKTLADNIFSEEKFSIISLLTGHSFKIVWYSSDNYEANTQDVDIESGCYGNSGVVELLEVGSNSTEDGIFLTSIDLNNARKTNDGWEISGFSFKLLNA